ncbi:MAG: helix-turn-helix domain-containing protein [Rhodospirillaceae bacterium]|nr:helix-turn-helix domain-containing protein [Rhodospirillaceae bacterium]
MTRKRNVAKQIVAAMEWAALHAEGKAKGGRLTVIYVPDVKDIRARLSLSQSQFAKRFGLNVRTVQDWEQGRKVPDQPARVLLRVIEKNPAAVSRALAI